MQRPASVTVFGILNIIFASFGILSLCCTLPMLVRPDLIERLSPGRPNPTLKIMQDSPGYRAFVIANIPLGLVTIALLLAAGIGMLKLKPSAHKLAIGYAVYAIVMAVVGTGVNYVYLARPLLEQASHQQRPEAIATISGAVGSVVGGCLGPIYPILLIIFMTRAKAVAAFHGADGEVLDVLLDPPDEPPGQGPA